MNRSVGLHRSFRPRHASYYVYTCYPIVNCPQCGRPYCLTHVNIDERGMVSPEIVCPYPTCDLRGTLVLIRWSKRDRDLWALGPRSST